MFVWKGEQMANKVSSPKILNIVVCVILLIIFVIYNAVNVNAEEINPKEELINKIELGNKYPSLINENKDLLALIANTLLEKETIDEKEFQEIMNNVKERRNS